jgi:hypothetical protein
MTHIRVSFPGISSIFDYFSECPTPSQVLGLFAGKAAPPPPLWKMVMSRGPIKQIRDIE